MAKKVFLKSLVISSFLLPFCSSASSVAPDLFKDALKKRLAFIFKDEKLDRTHLGVQVYSITRQETLFEMNPNAPLSPASTIKVLTGLVALKKLGPDYTFKTEVYVHGSLDHGVLRGDLYLKGGGDPSLVTERLALLVDEVMRSEIRTITGSIYVDDSTFDAIQIDPNRIASDTDRAYNAPIAGLNFNYNTTTLYFRPGEAPGARVKVFVEPNTGYVEVLNQSTTSSRTSSYGLVASRIKGKQSDAVLIKGSMPIGLKEQKTYFNITNPPVYAGQALRYFLESRGVKISGKEIKNKVLPANATKIAELESLPLREIVTLMNKYSNNFIAESLVKTLGRDLKGSPGSTRHGLEVILDEATRLGVNTAGFKVVSGSGLTRDNRTTAAQFVQLLNAAYLDFDVLPELLSSFPIAGRDGTLRNRMKGTSAFGRLRAKTGSIDGVSTLVGMVQSKGGELLAFSVLMNDLSKSPASMKPWQNFFGQALADFNRKNPLSEAPTPIQEPAPESSNMNGGPPLGSR